MKLQTEDLGNVGLIIEDWNISRSYRPRTMTIDYSTWITYISRKEVPAGIELTNNEYWKPYGRIEQELLFNYEKFKEKMEHDMNYLQQLVDSFLASSQYGVALANEFGSKQYVGINQKTITEAINKIWSKLEDMTGEALQGINMTVTPDYFISEDGADVHIHANTVETDGIFEHIAFYIDGTLIAEADNVDVFEHDVHIDATSIIKCVAKIMGVEYTAQHIITHYNSFWLGAGTVASDIMDESHVIPITNGMRGAYDVTVADDEHIIIVVGDSLKEGFIRADMNGFEIPMVESSVTVDGVDYKVFTSVNTYNAGTYNIDING